MRIWFDTEFIEDGKTIELLSIGAVRADGLSYYAEVGGVDYSRADPWVQENVIAHLYGGPAVKSRESIAETLKWFAGDDPEFWSYYADYDWVALCQIYGRMIDLPKGWPMFCRDIKQWCMDLGKSATSKARGRRAPRAFRRSVEQDSLGISATEKERFAN